jgi:hypothetical protein
MSEAQCKHDCLVSVVIYLLVVVVTRTIEECQ